MSLVDSGAPPESQRLFYTIPGQITQRIFASTEKTVIKKSAGFPAPRGMADMNIRRRNEASPENKKEK
jgi:hypothetical protein